MLKKTLLGCIFFLLVASAAEAKNQPASPWDKLDAGKLKLRSESALIIGTDGNLVYAKNPRQSMPIASITKLMTAIVVLDAELPLDARITIRKSDRDLLRLTGSRLHYNRATLSRGQLLRIALMASENRAAAALGRTSFPGGSKAFVEAMNRKAKQLGMKQTHFTDATGLDAGNVSSAQDLVLLLRAANDYPLIKKASTTRSLEVRPFPKKGPLRYVNTNRLLKNQNWSIQLSKTGYINESGRCLVMQASLQGQTFHIVLLNSFGKLTPFGDSNRFRKWVSPAL